METEALIGTTRDAIEMTRHLTGVYRNMTAEFIQAQRSRQPLIVTEMSAIIRYENRIVKQFFLKSNDQDSEE